jgi:hypothetical protein
VDDLGQITATNTWLIGQLHGGDVDALDAWDVLDAHLTMTVPRLVRCLRDQAAQRAVAADVDTVPMETIRSMEQEVARLQAREAVWEATCTGFRRERDEARRYCEVLAAQLPRLTEHMEALFSKLGLPLPTLDGHAERAINITREQK